MLNTWTPGQSRHQFGVEHITAPAARLTAPVNIPIHPVCQQAVARAWTPGTGPGSTQVPSTPQTSLLLCCVAMFCSFASYSRVKGRVKGRVKRSVVCRPPKHQDRSTANRITASFVVAQHCSLVQACWLLAPRAHQQTTPPVTAKPSE